MAISTPPDPENGPRDPEKGSPADPSTLVPVPSAARRDPARRLKVIEKKPLWALMDLAVAHVLGRRMRSYDPDTVANVQQEVKREFQRLLKLNSRNVRGVSKSAFMEELERSRNEILRSRDEAQKQLDDLLQQVDFFANIEDLDARALETGEKSFEEIHRHDMARSIQDLLARADRGEIGAAELQELLTSLASRSVREDRDRIQEARSTEYGSLVDTFERRIAKLNRALEDSERALAELAERKDTRGLPSVYRTVQGLSAEEENRRAKEAILRQIFLANLTMQQKPA